VKEQPVITESAPAPVFGRDGEPCPACGAPLAGDQRYCLHCGARRPEARLEFLDVLDADVRVRAAAPVAFAPAAAVAAGPPPSGLNARLQANAGLLALAALLLLTLLIGLLLGHWATRDSGTPGVAATPAPQVIRVEGTAAPATAAATPAGSGGASPSATKGAKAKAKAGGGGSSAKATAPKDAVSVDKLTSKKAVENAVKKGKPISTGTGKLPPKDGKPAGGGSGFESIG
jgi:hypothetical protein